MKIGLFSPLPISRQLGATKNRIEFAEALRGVGWDAEVFSAEQIGANPAFDRATYRSYQHRLRNFLNEHADAFDVALVEADTLPFDRATLPQNMLLVARPALLCTHFRLRPFPVPKFSFARRCVQSLKRRLNPARDWLPDQKRDLQIQTCQCVDLVHALTQWDADALRADGVRKTPIEVIPNGIDRTRVLALREGRGDSNEADPKSIVFVGTFDYRKGCLDIVDIMRRLWKSDPDYRITLLGAKGIFQHESQIRELFPKQRQGSVDIVMRYEAERLPQLLARTSIGLFTSYVEGFPFGCLEMIASGLPTVSYRSPGAESFVPQKLLVEPGDTAATTELIQRLSSDHRFHGDVAAECIDTGSHFDWHSVAWRADDVYRTALARRRGQRDVCLI